ncbi:MAG: ribulose-phosphate 3-epimerase [Myxococcota bacterium]
MAIVAPSILSADFGRLAQEVDEVVRLGAEWVHVDVMDGRFVPNLTIGPVVVSAVRDAVAGRAKIDVHLMMVEPERYVGAFREAGADSLTVHVEAVPHLHRVIGEIKATGAEAGVALNPGTPPELLDYVLEELDLVLVMSVNPGWGAQPLIDSAFRKLAALRETIERRKLPALLEVDGGVKPDNAGRFTDAGAQVLVAGSGVFKAADRAAAIRRLREA